MNDDWPSQNLNGLCFKFSGWGWECWFEGNKKYAECFQNDDEIDNFVRTLTDILEGPNIWFRNIRDHESSKPILDSSDSWYSMTNIIELSSRGTYRFHNFRWFSSFSLEKELLPAWLVSKACETDGSWTGFCFKINITPFTANNRYWAKNKCNYLRKSDFWNHFVTFPV